MMEQNIPRENNSVIENERVALHTLTSTDIEEFVYFATTEPEIWKYSLEQPTDLAKMATYVENAIAKNNVGNEHAFVVYDKLKQQTAGSTRIYEIDLSQKVCSIGYTWYGKNFQGTGLNKQAKYLLLKYAFETLEMERVQFKADNDNKRSLQAILSLGCTFEGVLRSNMYRPDKTRRDSAVFSMLREEWFSSGEINLLEKLNK